ncbi:MAG: hypothetical protein DWQ01_15525 [Planctomycetota bacterium]|nr:MAG: hypothetical protein DWQ01_15525 [Planctomycetota bacterium]
MAAKRRKKASRKPAKPAKPARAAKPAKPAADGAEQKPGMPVESAAALFTTIMLIVGLLLVDYENGSHYGGGWFFSGSYSGTSE